ncbi:PREDICTED: apolipoprotein D-like [Papilio xuthus]|uniref:Apolipoprotein D-like n=1 Tax=Papilio xuthus TaxID=66420 RepID=A0AAJ6ZBN9_PAPXU|nr:PREDICTED: apolipoprotein D-like [Papilio xuthus]
MLPLIVSLFLITFASGQIARNGTCNFGNILAVRDLNVTQLSGDWYQIKRIPNAQECGTCSTTKIYATQDSFSNITISNKEINEKKIKYRNGTIVVPYGVKNTVQGQFTITYEDIIYNSIVLATNYTNYAVVYSCKNINNSSKNVWAWVLSRNSTISKNEEKFVQSIINGNEDLKNVAWTIPDHSKKACDPNSGITIGLSPVLILLVVAVTGKDIFSNKL